MSQAAENERTRGWAIFAVCGLGFMLSQFYRVSATVISPALTQDLGLSVEELSRLSAAFFYTFALSQIPIGLALNRVGARRAMSVLSVAGLLGAGLFAAAHGPGQAMIGRLLLGVGMSCNLMGPLVLLAVWFPPSRFATLSGLLVGIGYLGSLLAATPLAWMSAHWGWRWAFVAVVLLHALQTLSMLLVVRDRPAGRTPAPSKAFHPLAGLGHILLRPAWWLVCLGSFFRYGCLAALMGLWAGPFLITGLGLSPVAAGNALLCLSLAHILGLPLTGRLSDQVFKTRKWVIIPGLLASAAFILLLGLLDRASPFWAICTLFALVGLAAAPGQIMYTHAKELASESAQAAAMAGVNLFTMLGPAAIMQTVGLLVAADPKDLAQPQAFWPAWLLMAGGLAAAGALYLLVPDTKSPGRARRP